MKIRKMKNNKKIKGKHIVARGLFALTIIISGIILEFFNIGNEFLGFESVGLWLLYVGFVMLALITINAMNKKERIVDERMEVIGHQASKLTFLFIIIGAFIVMIWDGINPIEIAYSMFMSYVIVLIVIVYIISYKIIEKKY